MSTSASGVRAATTLALWAAAWQAGQSADQVLAALDGTGVRAGIRSGSSEAAELSRLPGPGEPSAGTVELLGLLRRGGPPALLLPVAGDLRGLPVGGQIVIPALEAGAAVALPDAGVALVPAAGLWRAFPCGPAHPALDPGEAMHLLDSAVRDATRLLAVADVASAAGNPREAVRRAILAEEIETPVDTPAAASRLLARSITLAALLAAAAGHATTAATSRELAVVDDALHPLRSAVREARRTAVAITVTAMQAILDDLPASRATALASRRSQAR